MCPLGLDSQQPLVLRYDLLGLSVVVYLLQRETPLMQSVSYSCLWI